MKTEYVWAIISFIIVGTMAIGLLYLGAQGSLPALGLFDMSNMGVRVVVIAVLLVITLGLLAAYNNVRKRTK